MNETIKIPIIDLDWSEWHEWNNLRLDSRIKGNNGVNVPSKAGVYEAKYGSEEQRLTIGKAADLRNRVKQGLVRGKLPHSTGERMRSEISDFSKVLVRWAVTGRPSAAEEELHNRHVQKHGGLPKYVKRT